MNHRYFLKSNKEQSHIQLKIGIVAFFFNLIILAVAIVSGFYILFILSIVITLSIIAPFFDVPTLKKNGRLIYYSSLFIAEKEKNGTIIVHGGSLFDYVFVIDKTLNGIQRTNFILQRYLEGVLNLIANCEKEHNTSVKIKGTTYILNERTANKIGLKTTKTDFIQKLILTYNYVNVLVSNSIAKKKLSFPSMNNIKTFECEINDLIERKEFIIALNNKLKNTATNSL
ncbi:hypothetical protein [Flavobacterium sp.]|uniref:hypothetical protein n=1 Tax=Flavobacterium sp. TaxID=239 RepID=UPI0040487FBF